MSSKLFQLGFGAQMKVLVAKRTLAAKSSQPNVFTNSRVLKIMRSAFTELPAVYKRFHSNNWFMEQHTLLVE
jgi:hypothetical protein